MNDTTDTLALHERSPLQALLLVVAGAVLLCAAFALAAGAAHAQENTETTEATPEANTETSEATAESTPEPSPEPTPTPDDDGFGDPAFDDDGADDDDGTDDDEVVEEDTDGTETEGFATASSDESFQADTTATQVENIPAGGVAAGAGGLARASAGLLWWLAAAGLVAGFLTLRRRARGL